MGPLADVTLYLNDPDGNPVSGAQVRAVPESGGQAVVLRAAELPGHYAAGGLPPGPCRLEAAAPGTGLEPGTAQVELAPGANHAALGLGEPGTPFFYQGRTKITFRPVPHRHLLAASGLDARRLATEALERAGIRAELVTPAGPVREDPEPPRRGTEGAGAGRTAPRPESPNGTLVEADFSAENDSAAGARRLEAVAEELRGHGLDVKLALPIRREGRTAAGLTGELVVRFQDGVARAEVEAVAREHGLSVTRPVLYAGNAYVLAAAGIPTTALLDAAERLRAMATVRYAEPSLLTETVLDAFTPDDPLWPDQTYLPLIDCDDAWATLEAIDPAIRGGSAAITIAVVDADGVSPSHPDLTGTLTDGTPKMVANWNFDLKQAQTQAGLDKHGTQSAGTATAMLNNAQGIAGVAGNCHLIGVQYNSQPFVTDVDRADALVWCAGFSTGAPGFPPPPSRAADVISNGWGNNGWPLTSIEEDCLDFLTTYGRNGRGCVVCFSIGNNGYVPFTSGNKMRAWAAYPRTIAVGASINVNPTNPIVNSFDPDPSGNTASIATAVDTRALYSPYGMALDLVAPSNTGRISTGSNSFQNVDNLPSCVPGAPGFPDGYQQNFGGTSHAVPTVAGAAALVLSVNSALSWVEVRDILRASAVRIHLDNADPIGKWTDLDGDGVAEFSQWYGYGRLNVNAAVVATRDRVQAPDLVVRDNLADTGAVPSGGTWWESPDVWVRSTEAPVPVLAYDAAPPHENPVRGKDNWIYCRVKNTGAAPVGTAYVRVMLASFPGMEFRYPDDFTPDVPFGGVPTKLVPGTYLIGEAPLDALEPGEVRIVKVKWPAALVPPKTVTVDGTEAAWHPCLLVEVSPHDGPLPPGAHFHVHECNNLAQLNVQIVDLVPSSGSSLWSAVVAGTHEEVGVDALVLDGSAMRGAPVSVYLSPEADLMPALLEHARRNGGAEPRGWFARLIQAVIRFLRRLFGLRDPAPADGLRLRATRHQGRDAVEVSGARGVVELPLRLAAGRFSPVLVALPGARGDWGKLGITQRKRNGQASPGYGFASAAAEPDRPR